MRRCHGERGQAAGVETIPFAVLVFVAGMLLAVNAWAVVDTRAALDAAAREYLRAYTAAADAGEARTAGDHAARTSIGDRLAPRLRIIPPRGIFGACRPATVVLALDVEAVRLPFVDGLGRTTASTTQTELVQPYARARSADAPDPSPCDA